AARARPAAPLRVPRPARRRGAGRPRPAARPRLPRGARRRRGTGEPGRRRAPSARPRGGAGRRSPSRHSQPVRGLALSALLAVGSVWTGLVLSYLIPTLPPSTMIISTATLV